MKKMLSFLLVLSMMFSLLPQQVFASEAKVGDGGAAAPTAEGGDTLPIHFFLASPGNINNPNGSYVNYYGPSGSAKNWNGAETISGIKQSSEWSRIYTQTGIRNVSDESIVTKYIASYPNGYNAATFKDFGSVTISGTTYYDTEYEIKWVSIMCRNNGLSNIGLNCQQRTFKGEHIHVDGLLVKKVEPGQMKVFKAISENNISETSATTFQFKLEKMRQSSLTTPPSSANDVDTSFEPLSLTATIAAGEREAQITGGSQITFGYYKLTEIPNETWNMTGITLTDGNNRSQTITADALYICIAPDGSVLYSTNASGTYTTMKHVAMQNVRKPVTVTYQWRIYDGSETYSEILPGTLGAHSVPAVTNVEFGSNFTYNTGYVEGTTYHDYENGKLYTFHGWDTYSHSSLFEVDPSAAGYEALDDGDADATNNKKIPMTADTWINGYWSVSDLEAADAYLMVHKDVVVAEGGDADYVKNYLQNTGKMFIQIDPGIDLNEDGKSQVDADYLGVIAENGYRVNVYQYDKDFIFTEKQANVPGYTRDTRVAVTSDSNLTLVSQSGDTATVHIEEEYDPAKAPYKLGTVTYTNTYTKNIGESVTEYPTLTLVKRAIDTGLLQAGATFTLYSDINCTNEIGTYTTTEDGIVEIPFEMILNQDPETFTAYLKETAAPKGYLIDSSVYTLTLKRSSEEVLRDNAYITFSSYTLAITAPEASSAEPVQSVVSELDYSLNVYNAPILGNVTLIKAATGLDEGDKEQMNATFTIHGPITRDANDNITALGSTYNLSLHTDNGWTDIKKDLPVGEYLLHENTASVHGYTWDSENIDYGNLDKTVYNDITSAIFEVTAESTELEITITNTYKKWEAADFSILKTAPNGSALPGATFTLYEDEACTKVSEIPSVTTAANGYASFSGFTVPAEDADQMVTYYLKETAAPAGYYLSDTIYRLDIKADGNKYDTNISVKSEGKWIEASGFAKTTDILTVVNEPVKGSITITKQMLGAPEKLDSVTFYVTGPNGYAKNVTLSNSGGWSTTLTDLALGEYTIIESEAEAVGYSLITTYSVNGGDETTNQAVVELKEAESGNTTARSVIAGNVDITNKYTRNDVYYDVPTRLTVKKVGEAGEALPGAKFRLDRLDAAGKEVIDTITLTTGASGTVTFELLIGHTSADGKTIQNGEYRLSEVVAPEGYVKSDTDWIVTVEEDDDEVRVEVNEDQNVFENFWDWIVGNVDDGTYENGILTITNKKKVGDLVIKKVVVDEEGCYENAEYNFTLDSSDDDFDKTFTLKANESYTVKDIPWGTTYTLIEDTTDAAFVSTINDPGEGLIWADSTAITVTNTYAYAAHNNGLNLVKVDADDTTKVIPGAGFTLYADEDLITKLGSEVFSDANGKLTLPIEAAGTYFLKETTIPEGYHYNFNIYVVTAEEKAVVKNAGTTDALTEFQMHIRISELTGSTDNQIDYSYNIENTAIKNIVVNVEKLWDDGGYHGRPDSVDVTLYQNGDTVETITLNEGNNWSHSWIGLTDEYDWSVDEEIIPGQYSKTVENDGNDWTITNSRTPKPVEISVTKAWQHNGGKDLPEAIEVVLYQDGEKYDTISLNAENDWTHTWTDLTDVSVWSVNEVDVPAGYTKEIITEDGLEFTIVNTRVINPVEISVDKVWVVSKDSIIPESVEAVLYRDGEAYDTITLNAANEWSYTWTDLTDEYTWSVDEKSVPAGYTKNVTNDGYDFTITNTKNFEFIDVSVSKIWYGADVVHPTSVQITLYRDGTEYDTVTLSASNGWSYTWKNLTDEFEWTMDEPSVPSGYNKTVRRNGNSFIITNTHEDNPKTGDFTNLFGMGAMATVGAIGFGATALKLVPRRKKEEEEE